MFKFILSVIVFTFLNFAAHAESQTVSFTQNVISFDEKYFLESDVEVIKIEHEYRVNMGGFGPYRVYGDYIITLKVKNRDYDKGFEVNNKIALITNHRYLGASQDYDLWEVKTKVDVSNFDVNVFMPAKFWNGTPTYGTPSGPTYMGPSFNVSVSIIR